MRRYSEEMGFVELWTYIEKIQASGYNATRYLVDLHSKLSNPFLNFIMVLIGIPFALKTSRSGGVALSIGISVTIGFAYGLIYYIFISFGKSGSSLLFSLVGPYLPLWSGRHLHLDEPQAIIGYQRTRSSGYQDKRDHFSLIAL